MFTMGLKFQDEEEGKRFDDRDSNPPNGAASFSKMTLITMAFNLTSKLVTVSRNFLIHYPEGC